jgi:glycosyltransferase involved in cell wall biosynthesis
MSQPLVSVIVPAYNGERYLALALKSVFEQGYRRFEVIVVDDGSVDHTSDITKSFPEIRYIHQANQGVAVARNVGIDAAAGEFIAFLDQDDLWTPNKLDQQVDYLLKHPELGYVLAHQRLFLEPGTDPPPWLRKHLLLKDHPAYVPSALTVRKTVFQKVGYFNPAYKMGSDSDWFFRAKKCGVAAAVLPETLLLRRIHGGNQSQSQSALSEMLKIVKSSVDHHRGQCSGDIG